MNKAVCKGLHFLFHFQFYDLNGTNEIENCKSVKKGMKSAFKWTINSLFTSFSNGLLQKNIQVPTFCSFIVILFTDYLILIVFLF